MAISEREIRIELGARSYPAIIGRGVLGEAGSRLQAMGFAGRVAVVTQQVPGDLFFPGLNAGLEAAGLHAVRIDIHGEEDAKSLASAEQLYERFISEGFDRWVPVMALGGGVVGDLAGFAAGTYMRGMPFFQAPTTFLSQVDSSIGGKVAVNHPRAKNLIGLFYQPRAVFSDTRCLESLPPRELRAGLAEVIRYAVIADEAFFRWLEENHRLVLERDPAALLETVARCVAIKGAIVSRDETEEGDIRALLNYGHTIGHAVEAATGFGTLRHGEAVSIGMVAAALLSRRTGRCDVETVERQIDLLKAVGLPVSLENVSAEIVLNSLKLDKKTKNGKLRFVLTEGIGSAKVCREVDMGEIPKVLAELGSGPRSRLA